MKNFVFLFLFIAVTASAQANNDSLDLILEKIENLENELARLSNQIDSNTFELQKLDESNQARYVDLDKRIHELEAIILLSKEEEVVEEKIELNNPLAELIEKDGEEEEFTLWSNTLKLIDNSRYSEAAENLRLLILSYPNGTYTGDAYFWLGEIYLVQEMFEDSSEVLNAFVAKFDDHPRSADGLYKLALAKVNLEELESAETLLQEVISNYPNSGAALLAEQDLIKLTSQ